MRLVVVGVSMVLLGACGQKAPPGAHGKGAPGAAGATAAAPAAISGKVLETMDAGGYTYMRIAGPGGEAWAAVPQTSVSVGQTVTLKDPMEMSQFQSKTLKRTFDRILFAQLDTAGGAPAAGGGAKPASQAAMPPGHPPLPGQEPAGAGSQPEHPRPAPPAMDVSKIKVPKAAGPDGRTVAEVNTGRAALKDKPVVVQGVVVKYNSGIMGKNWIHVRDGSGKAGSGDDDLTVTTQDTSSVGAKVRVRGTVRLDKDFGYGYKYATIVEGAKVEPLP
ncbi:MAG TPA: nucleotide-binding protein [Polyangia bacterium]